MNKKKSTLTPKLRQNWWIDAVLGVTAVLTVISSIYFLVYPNSGYQGGHNPQYNTVLIFNRQVWDLVHTWSSIGMIAAALIHIIIHWDWITGTLNRSWQVLTRKRKPFRSRLTYNIVLDGSIAISFLICMISGLYFLYFAQRGPTNEVLLFTRTTWDLIHTWSGVIMTIAAILHFALHWKWVTNITRKMFPGRTKLQTNQVVTSPMESN